MILINNTRLIDPKKKIDKKVNIFIKNKKIVNIKEEEILLNKEEKEQVIIIDGENLISAPGLIDVHVHFRDPGFTYKEDIFTGEKSAKKGGFTTVMCMANTKPIIDNVDIYKQCKNKMNDCSINVLQAAAVTKNFEEELVNFNELFNCGVKCFTNDGVPIMNTDILRKAMIETKKINSIISLHEEDKNLVKNPGVNAGIIAKSLGLEGAYKSAEEVMIARDCALALETGAKINIQHISSGESVDIISDAKKRGVKVFAEVSPHHFSLNENDVLKYNTYAKMNPPLRMESDRLKLIKGMQDGIIEIIATDHAPHQKSEKENQFTKAPSGIIGLETSLSLGITNLVKTGYLTVSQLIKMMTCNPADIFDLNGGTLDVGEYADLVLFDLNEKYIIDENFESKSSNSPFIGEALFGKVKYTICNGEIVYKD